MWKIVKANDPVDGPPYDGPTCRVARVPMGKIYSVRDEAEKDALKLLAHNSIGYYVVECDEKGNVP